MIFNDSWTIGLTKQQQTCIMDYVLNECRLFDGIGGYKKLKTAKKFLESEKGRVAIVKYCEFFTDTKKDTIKLRAIRINLIRAFYNPADIIDADGRFVIEDMKDLRKLGDLAYAIEGINTEWDKEGNKITKIKLCDRNKAMDFLTKAFRLFEESNTEDQIGEKSIFAMSDEEREEEIRRLLEKKQKLLSDGKKNETTDN